MFTDKNLEHLRAIFEVYDKPFTKNIAKIYASCLSTFDEEAIEKGLDLSQLIVLTVSRRLTRLTMSL